MRPVVVAVFVAAAFIAGARAQDVDPLALMQGLLRQRVEQDSIRHQIEMMKLRRELQAQQDRERYRSMTDDQMILFWRHYCPPSEKYCRPDIPEPLAEELERRGFIQRADTNAPQPKQECLMYGDGEGGGLIRCY